ncbi:MAG: GNAT family N-acetyltransferase [Polyangiaceae bacterium]
MSTRIEVVAAGAAHAEGLRRLLTAESRGCHCGWWHFEGDDYAWQARCNLEPEQNAAGFAGWLVADDARAAGVVALLEGEVVGWLKLAPSPVMGKLFGRRVYRTLGCFDGERDDVLVIGCLVVRSDQRRNGVARALVVGALEVAAARGARAVEAMPRRSSSPLRDEEHWMGPPEIFEAAGFEQVDGPTPYPVLRRTLR